jgi:nicotinamide mononucleotide (NMN) deamidase PncC
VDRAVVAYSNAAKVDLLGVEPGVIDQHGAVSEAVALAMAEGVRTGRLSTSVSALLASPGRAAERRRSQSGRSRFAAVTPSTTRTRMFRFHGEREHV